MAGGGFNDNRERLAFAPSEATAGALLDADSRMFGDRPVTVLSAAGTIDDLPPLPDDLRDAWWSVWLDEQQRYADESSRGTFVVVDGSGHMVMEDQPAAVIDAVEEMLSWITES